MRRFGDTDKFLDLIAQIRTKAPLAGIRSNFIVGFPGEELTIDYRFGKDVDIVLCGCGAAKCRGTINLFE